MTACVFLVAVGHIKIASCVTSCWNTMYLRNYAEKIFEILGPVAICTPMHKDHLEIILDTQRNQGHHTHMFVLKLQNNFHRSTLSTGIFHDSLYI